VSGAIPLIASTSSGFGWCVLVLRPGLIAKIFNSLPFLPRRAAAFEIFFALACIAKLPEAIQLKTELEQEVGRPVENSAFCVAGRGIIIRSIAAAPTVTGTNPPIATTTSGFGWCVLVLRPRLFAYVSVSLRETDTQLRLAGASPAVYGLRERRTTLRQINWSSLWPSGRKSPDRSPVLAVRYNLHAAGQIKTDARRVW
jgi:hypothetical protein